MCRGGGALPQLLGAAVAVEDVSLQRALVAGRPGGELLAALRPAAGTLRALDFTDLDIETDVRTNETPLPYPTRTG